jgi:hypothetical protein
MVRNHLMDEQSNLASSIGRHTSHHDAIYHIEALCKVSLTCAATHNVTDKLVGALSIGKLIVGSVEGTAFLVKFGYFVVLISNGWHEVGYDRITVAVNELDTTRRVLVDLWLLKKNRQTVSNLVML